MSGADRIKVGVLHADPIARAGLMVACSRFPELDLDEAPCAADSPPRAYLPPVQASWHVVVADYALGYSVAARAARDGHSWPRVVVLTALQREAEIRSALLAGVRGYLLAGCGADEVAAAVHAAYRGIRHMSPQIAARLAESVSHESLTSREHEVLTLVARGLPNKAIATRLEISAGTVKSHLKAIFAKLDVRSRTQAMVMAEERGILCAMQGGALQGVHAAVGRS
jgi:two-component system response regulator DesR